MNKLNNIQYLIKTSQIDHLKKIFINRDRMNYYIPGKSETPLIYAVKNNKLDIVKYLVENGVLIDITDHANNTALDYACRYKLRHKCNLDLIKYLLDHGASITSYKRNALIYSIYKSTEMLQLLLEYATKEQLNHKNKNETPLYYAAYLKQYEHLKILVDKGANVNITGPHKDTALSYLCKKYNDTQDLEIIKYLLDHGADVNIKDTYSYSPLMNICNIKKSNTQVFKLLIEHSAEFTETKIGGITELMCACYNNNLEIAKILIEDHKVPINKVSKSEKTALMEINNLYIYYHRNVNKTDHIKTEYAKLIELIKLLLRNGAKTYSDTLSTEAQCLTDTKRFLNKIFDGKIPDDILELLIHDQ